MSAVIKCHSVNYDTFNAKLTLFKMSLLWQLDINKDKKMSLWQLDINQDKNFFVMTTWQEIIGRS